MINFELTKSQIGIAKPVLDLAQKEHNQGRTGIVIAQIAKHNDGKTKCVFGFVEEKTSQKIQKILVRYYSRGEK